MRKDDLVRLCHMRDAAREAAGFVAARAYPDLHADRQLTLALVKEVEIIGEAGDGREGIRLAGQLRPDVVLLDNNMPGLSGREAARLMLEEAPEARVLMLTVSEGSDDLIETLRAGACGYLLKNIQAEALVAAIKAAAQGESVVSPQMMGKLLSGVRDGAGRASGEDGAASWPARVGAARTSSASVGEGGDADRLSPREREMLHFIARGQSNKEIARTLEQLDY